MAKQQPHESRPVDTRDVHPTAVIAPGARIGAGARIGPFCRIDAEVDLGADAVLHSHVVVTGRTRIGEKVEIFPFACVGHAPQDLKYSGEPSEVLIGARCRIREHVTINPGTRGGGMVTRIGDDCLIMAGAHVAHDCQIGNHVILVNNAILGGHVHVGDYAIIGGMSAVHQFVRIGAHAMIGGMSGVESDVIPFGTVMGDRAHLVGLNLVGLKRRGFEREAMHDLQKAYRMLFGDEGTFQERIADVREEFGGNALVGEVLSFIVADSDRALCHPRAARGG
jgi:UDP-N-acetylglucosamine acyltransferase